MTTRGQLFNGEMVRAILAGRKTETRRPITKTNSRKVEFWSSQLGCDWGTGGFADLDWDAHVVEMLSKIVDGKAVDDRPHPGGTPCTSRCKGRDHCCILVDGDARDGGQYLHVPGVGGETRQRVYAHVEPGDQLYVRETHAPKYFPDESTLYRADWDRPRFVPEPEWTPSIHMPKDLARINLRVTAVHAERIQDITNDGAKAEGIKPDHRAMTPSEFANHPESHENGGQSASLPDYRAPFARLWDGIYGKQYDEDGDPIGPFGLAWRDNPWVWRTMFEVMP